MADIAHNLAMEVGLGFEDAACNEVSLDLGEPDLDLIKPRGIGRGVMELDVGMGVQKSLNGCSFMSRKVVGDDMNVGFSGLSGDHLGEKLHELGAGVAVSCLLLIRLFQQATTYWGRPSAGSFGMSFAPRISS